MSDPTDDLVTDETREAEEAEAQQPGSPDRPPTPDEERLAERHEVDPDVAEAYQEATERGANLTGEGRIE
jgi:hypothetical protein